MHWIDVPYPFDTFDGKLVSFHGNPDDYTGNVVLIDYNFTGNIGRSTFYDKARTVIDAGARAIVVGRYYKRTCDSWASVARAGLTDLHFEYSKSICQCYDS